MIHRGHEAAAEALQQLGGSGKASVPLNALERVLVLLCRATLQLHAGDPNGATATLGEVNPLLDGAAGADDTLFKQASGPADRAVGAVGLRPLTHPCSPLTLITEPTSSRLAPLPAAHLPLLSPVRGSGHRCGPRQRAQAGCVAAPHVPTVPPAPCVRPPASLCAHGPTLPAPATPPTDPQGNIQLLATLQQLLKEVAGQPWSYAWLPTRAVATVGFLLHASLLRSLGKAAPAAAYLAAAEEEIEQQLAAVGLDLAGSEGELSSQAMWDGRLWCQLRCLLAEQHVLVALLASRFAQARRRRRTTTTTTAHLVCLGLPLDAGPSCG